MRLDYTFLVGIIWLLILLEHKNNINIYIIMNKIYIDSTFKTIDSKSDSDFRVNLTQPVEIKDDSKLYITDVNIPNSF